MSDDDLVIKPKPEPDAFIDVPAAQVQAVHDKIKESLDRRAGIKRAQGGGVGYLQERACQAVALSVLAATTLMELPDPLREAVQQYVTQHMRRAST